MTAGQRYKRYVPRIAVFGYVPSKGLAHLSKMHGYIHHWESWETFPTRIFNLEIYCGISPVKSQLRPDNDPLKFDVDLFTQNLTTPEK